MNFLGQSPFTILGAGGGNVKDPQTAINTADIATNRVGIAINTSNISTSADQIERNRIGIIDNTFSINANVEIVAEIYAQPVSTGTTSQRQWTDGVLSGPGYPLWVKGLGITTIPTQDGTLRAYGFSTKPSIVSLIPTTSSDGGSIGIQFQYDTTKSVSVEMDVRCGFFNTGSVITRVSTFCNLIYLDRSGTILGNLQQFTLNSSNGQTTLEVFNVTKFQVDLKLAPAGTTLIQVIPYFGALFNGTLQTTCIGEMTSSSRNRLRVTIRKIY